MPVFSAGGDGGAPGALPTFQADVQQFTRVRSFEPSAADALAQGFQHLTQQLGQWHSRAAEDEGVQAGNVAGIDPNYRPNGDESLYGVARRKAANFTYGNLVEANARTALDQAYQNWQALPPAQRDPAALAKTIGGIKSDFDTNHVFPTIQGQFDASFSRLSDMYTRAGQADADKRAQDAAKASFTQNDNAAQTTALRAASLPSASDADIAAALTERNAAVDRGVEQGIFSQTQAVEMKEALKQQAFGVRAKTLFDNLPPEQKAAAAENFAKSFGGQGDYFSAVRQIESGGNDQAGSPAGAQGRYQFLLGTWRALAEAHPGLGLTPDGRTDPNQQEKAIRAFTSDNEAALSAAGVPINDQNRYAAHFLGAGGAVKLVNAVSSSPNESASSVFPAAAAANPTIFNGPNGPRSVAEVYGLIGDKVRNAGAGVGQTGGMDYATASNVTKYMDAQVRAQESQAQHIQKAQVSDIHGDVAQMEKGFDVPDAEWSAKRQEYGAGPDPMVRDEFQTADAIRTMYQGFRGKTPEAVDAEIAGMKAQLAQGVTPQQAKIVEAGEKYADGLRKDFARDPLSRAVTEGLVRQPPPLDMSSPDKFASTLEQRIPAAEQAQQRFGLARPPYVTPDEKEQLKAVAAAGGPPAVAIASTIAKVMGPKAGPLFAEIGGEAPQFAQMGRIAAVGGDAGVLQDAAWTTAQDHQPGSKVLRPSPELVAQQINAQIGPALRAIPDFAEGVRNLASSALAAQIAREGLDPKALDVNVVNRTLQKAAGATFVGNQQYGGVAPYGGFWSGAPAQKVLVPPDVRADSFPQLISQINDADLKGLPKPAEARDGSTMKAADLQKAYLTPVGWGLYTVSKGDPTGDDPQWATTKDGGKFVLDLNALSSTLRQRLPQAYKGVGS